MVGVAVPSPSLSPQAAASKPNTSSSASSLLHFTFMVIPFRIHALPGNEFAWPHVMPGHGLVVRSHGLWRMRSRRPADALLWCSGLAIGQRHLHGSRFDQRMMASNVVVIRNSRHLRFLSSALAVGARAAGAETAPRWRIDG